MEIVLLQRIEKLGQMGDVVTVKDGYGRNYLLRHGKALRATKANLARFETERAQLETRNLELRGEAEAAAKKLDGQMFVIIRQASEAGSLYGSVTGRDIAESATVGGFSVARSQVAIDRPVKELGIHPIRIILHPEVSATISVNVARSEDEAKLQAAGRSIQDIRVEEDTAAEFAVSELFDDLGGAANEDGFGGESTLVEDHKPG
jgi:large subunit ribosomal protein L9